MKTSLLAAIVLAATTVLSADAQDPYFSLNDCYATCANKCNGSDEQVAKCRVWCRNIFVHQIIPPPDPPACIFSAPCKPCYTGLVPNCAPTACPTPNLVPAAPVPSYAYGQYGCPQPVQPVCAPSPCQPACRTWNPCPQPRYHNYGCHYRTRVIHPRRYGCFR